jgi:hypothetical protein
MLLRGSIVYLDSGILQVVQKEERMSVWGRTSGVSRLGVRMGEGSVARALDGGAGVLSSFDAWSTLQDWTRELACTGHRRASGIWVSLQRPIGHGRNGDGWGIQVGVDSHIRIATMILSKVECRVWIRHHAD